MTYVLHAGSGGEATLAALVQGANMQQTPHTSHLGSMQLPHGMTHGLNGLHMLGGGGTGRGNSLHLIGDLTAAAHAICASGTDPTAEGPRAILCHRPIAKPVVLC